MNTCSRSLTTHQNTKAHYMYQQLRRKIVNALTVFVYRCLQMAKITHKTHTPLPSPRHPSLTGPRQNSTGLCNFRGSLIVTRPHTMRKLCHDESD